MAAQWDWFAKTGILFTVSVYLAFIVYSKERNLSVDFYLAVVWVLILLGAWEAFVGIRQVIWIFLFQSFVI